MTQGGEELDRHRERPRSRFSGFERCHNIDELTRKMLNEDLDEVHVKRGHRQCTLVREGNLTIALFHFEEGGKLNEHEVNGVTCLHVLDGQIEVETDLSQQVLAAGDYFVIEPGNSHSIYAFDESQVMLTISMQGDS